MKSLFFESYLIHPINEQYTEKMAELRSENSLLHQRSDITKTLELQKERLNQELEQVTFFFLL